ncbi:MAG: hypothetical protein M1832_002791 [Thelocarpon impressellum]|nr:MAG: hypothetical protein M1832_002791 [Thelocarpon impressellum]
MPAPSKVLPRIDTRQIPHPPSSPPSSGSISVVSGRFGDFDEERGGDDGPSDFTENMVAHMTADDNVHSRRAPARAVEVQEEQLAEMKVEIKAEMKAEMAALRELVSLNTQMSEIKDELAAAEDLANVRDHMRQLRTDEMAAIRLELLEMKELSQMRTDAEAVRSDVAADAARRQESVKSAIPDRVEVLPVVSMAPESSEGYRPRKASESDAEAVKAEVAKLEVEAERTQDEIAHLREVSEAAKVQVVKLKEEALRSQAETVQLRHVGEAAKTQVVELKEEAERSQAEVVQLRLTSVVARTEVVKLNEEAERSQAEIVRLRNASDAAKAEVVKLRAEAERSQAKILELRNVSEAAKLEVVTLKEESERFQAEILKLRDVGEAAKAAVVTLKEEPARSPAEIVQLRQGRDAAKDQISKLKNRLERTKRDNSRALKTMEQAHQRELEEMCKAAEGKCLEMIEGNDKGVRSACDDCKAGREQLRACLAQLDASEAKAKAVVGEASRWAASIDAERDAERDALEARCRELQTELAKANKAATNAVSLATERERAAKDMKHRVQKSMMDRELMSRALLREWGSNENAPASPEEAQPYRYRHFRN